MGEAGKRNVGVAWVGVMVGNSFIWQACRGAAKRQELGILLWVLGS